MQQIGYSLISTKDGAELLRFSSIPPSFRIPGTKIDVMGAGEGWAESGYKIVPCVANAVLPTSLHKQTGEVVGGDGTKVTVTPIFELPAREEIISRLASRAWALFGEAFFLKNTLNDWTGYRASLKTRGLELLAAFDEGGHDIDISAGSIDGAGAWPE